MTLPAPSIFILLTALLWMGSALAAGLPAVARLALEKGETVELIVEYQAAQIEGELVASRRQLPDPGRDAAALDTLRSQRFEELRQRVDRDSRLPAEARRKDYALLPMALRRFRTLAEAEAYVAHPDVKVVYEDSRLMPMLAQSLPLIGQPTVAAATAAGSGATIAVIDNGIDYTRAEFGSCTAPGVPAGCKVVVARDFGTGTTDKNHGTNVSAIALGVAPASRIAMLNAYSGSYALSSDVIAAIDWAIANRAAYNIVAINMSLGESGYVSSTPCSLANPFVTPVANARNAGIAVVASAGNEARKDGISRPACTPGVISVGAVYDANVGSLTWGNNLCTDATTAADKVACFTNSAANLTLMAPGAVINAAGISMGGTSQAAPHVAGAVAALRALYPGETLVQTEARLTSTGSPVTDPGNGLTFPRLALLAGARPKNDAFASATSLSGQTGSTTGQNALASKETGEPAHAGNPGGRSLWWKWTAPAAGQVSLDSLGSHFDTLLAVYRGNSIGALTLVTANDNDPQRVDGGSRVLFQATAGSEYLIALDGYAGASGSVALNWQLDTAAQSNLSLGISGAACGSDCASYTFVLTNAGPQAATNVKVIVTLPGNASLLSASPGCIAGSGQIVCEIGLLASGGNAALGLQLAWTTGASYQIAASVQSDVPDPVIADNSQTLAIVLGAMADGDVPTLPEWGMMLLALLLAGLVTRGRDEHNSRAT